MSTQEILAEIEKLPAREFAELQTEMASLAVHRFSSEEHAEIAEALREADQQIKSGDTFALEEVRREFGLS